MRNCKHPILSREEEHELLVRYRGGDRRAGDRLVLCNQRLVMLHASRWASRGLPLEDLVQEGNVGLLIALQRFELDRGHRFGTYAVLWVRAQMGVYAVKQPSVVRTNMRDKKWPKRDASLDDKPRDHDETYLDRLVDTRPLPDEVAAERQCAGHDHVERFLVGLSDFERDVVQRRVLADDRETLNEIGVTYDVSRERVRQIESRALRKIRKRLAA